MNHHHHQHYRQPRPVDIAKAANSAKACNASGCAELRNGLDLHCTNHQRTHSRYGHPLARPVKPSDYFAYRKPVLEIFKANASHPGLVSALDWVTKWMETATASAVTSATVKALKEAHEVARLVRHGVTPFDVLVEVCAFWCWLQDNPRALPDTKAEDFGLSRAVLGLAPRLRTVTAEAIAKGKHGYAVRPKFSALNVIGSQMRAVLCFFLVNTHEAVSTRDTRKAQTLEQLRAPLVSPTAVYLSEMAKAPARPFMPLRDTPDGSSHETATPGASVQPSMPFAGHSSAK